MSSTPNSAAEASTTSSSPASCMASNNNAPKYGTRVPNRVFVGGLSADTTESEMELLFSTYGTVTSVKIISDRAGVSKGYGFITFETEDQANSLVRMNEVYLKTRKLNIAPAIKKQYDPLGSLPTTYGRSSYDTSPSPNVPNGSVYYSSTGIPYTFQNNGLSYYPTAAAAAAVSAAQQQQEAYNAAYSQHHQQQTAATTPTAYSSYPYMYPAAAAAAAAQAMYAAPQQYSYQMPAQSSSGYEPVTYLPSPVQYVLIDRMY